MNDLAKLAEYGSCGIAIAMIIAIVYLICKLAPLFFSALAEMRKSINANTKVTTQMYQFLKNLNGRLAKSTKGTRGEKGDKGERGAKGK